MVQDMYDPEFFLGTYEVLQHPPIDLSTFPWHFAMEGEGRQNYCYKESV